MTELSRPYSLGYVVEQEPFSALYFDGARLPEVWQRRVEYVEVVEEERKKSSLSFHLSDPHQELLAAPIVRYGMMVSVDLGNVRLFERRGPFTITNIEKKFNGRLLTWQVSAEAGKKLDSTTHRRVFSSGTVVDLIRRIALEHDMEFVQEGEVEDMPFTEEHGIVQTGETDARFLMRLAEELGLVLQVDGERVTLSPPLIRKSLGTLVLSYQQGDSPIESISLKQKKPRVNYVPVTSKTDTSPDLRAGMKQLHPKAPSAPVPTGNAALDGAIAQLATFEKEQQELTGALGATLSNPAYGRNSPAKYVLDDQGELKQVVGTGSMLGSMDIVNSAALNKIFNNDPEADATEDDIAAWTAALDAQLEPGAMPGLDVGGKMLPEGADSEDKGSAKKRTRKRRVLSEAGLESVSLALKFGLIWVRPQQHLILTNIGPTIDGAYRVSKVVHTLDGKFNTKLELKVGWETARKKAKGKPDPKGPPRSVDEGRKAPVPEGPLVDEPKAIYKRFVTMDYTTGEASVAFREVEKSGKPITPTESN